MDKIVEELEEEILRLTEENRKLKEECEKGGTVLDFLAFLKFQGVIIGIALLLYFFGIVK
jgi:hypothetical protein